MTQSNNNNHYVIDPKLDRFIKKLPKTELHLHIEGALGPELMLRLADRNGIKLRFKNVEEIRQAYNFHNLQSFLDIYYQGAAVLQKEEDFFELMMDYLEKAHADGVVHSEIFFDPQTHTERKIPFEIFIQGFSRALDEGKKKFGISGKLIMCFLRHLSEEEAFATLDQAMPYLDKIVGVGLDSSERDHPPTKFERVFKKCHNLGLKLVAHAGEEGPPEYIWQALDQLKVSRIDHGVRSIEDQSLLARLKEERIPLTVCPLSNVKLRVFKSLDQHNLKQLLDQGLCITINSDDPTYFGGYIHENFSQTAAALNLNENQIRQLMKNSFEASYLEKDQKEKFIQIIETTPF